MRKRADLLLVERALFESRARAQAAIAAGLVTANGVAVTKGAQLVDADAVIEASPAHPYVSRGGVKLAHLLDMFCLDVTSYTALDLGASTGGFSDVLLRRGAAKVYAVDVGHDQLHPSLKCHPRLVCLEGTDARSLDRTLIPLPVDIIVADLSFISLTLALSPAFELAAQKAVLGLLIKPQFEAGRSRVGKGGIVRDIKVRHEVCERVRDFVSSHGWRMRGVIESPVAGGDGNQEFLLAAERGYE